jgi:hypothetical protein
MRGAKDSSDWISTKSTRTFQQGADLLQALTRACNRREGGQRKDRRLKPSSAVMNSPSVNRKFDLCAHSLDGVPMARGVTRHTQTCQPASTTRCGDKMILAWSVHTCSKCTGCHSLRSAPQAAECSPPGGCGGTALACQACHGRLTSCHKTMQEDRTGPKLAYIHTHSHAMWVPLVFASALTLVRSTGG